MNDKKNAAHESEMSLSELAEPFRKTGDDVDKEPLENSRPEKDRYWTDQIDAIAHELSILAIACDIEFFEPGNAEKILQNDHSVCRRENPQAFRKIRQHLMALFPLEQAAIERLGADDTREILDQVRASVAALRSAGHSQGPGASTSG